MTIDTIGDRPSYEEAVALGAHIFRSLDGKLFKSTDDAEAITIYGLMVAEVYEKPRIAVVMDIIKHARHK